MGATIPNQKNNLGRLAREAVISVAKRPSGRRIAPCADSRIYAPWQIEREQLLLRLCRCIEARVEHGQSICKAARKVSRKWSGRCYKSDPTRKIRLSVPYLATLYRKWKHDPSAECFRLRYVGPKARKVPAAFIFEVARRASAPGVYSLQSVLRGISADLKRGKRIPGLPKFSRNNLPASLPFARTAHRYFSGIDLSLRRRIFAAIAAQMARLSEIDLAIAHRAKGVAAKTQDAEWKP